MPRVKALRIAVNRQQSLWRADLPGMRLREDVRLNPVFVVGAATSARVSRTLFLTILASMLQEPTQRALDSRICAAMDVTDGGDRGTTRVDWWKCRATAGLINGV